MRLGSLAGLPIVKVPPGIGTISNLTSVPGMDSVVRRGRGALGDARHLQADDEC